MENTTLVILDIPIEELSKKEHKDYVGFLFKNGNGVYNICRTEEDVIKSNQWFQNLPKRVIIISSEDPIKNPILVGDKFFAQTTNEVLNNKIFTYLGVHKEGVGLVDVISEDGNSHISTKYLLDSKKYLRDASAEELEKIVQRQSKCIF